MRTPRPRVVLLLVTCVAFACEAAEARVPVRWGYDLALHADLSRTTGDLQPEGRAFPLSGAVAGTLRVPAGRGLTLVAGVGDEHLVRTEHIKDSFDLTGSSTSFELTFQRRYRSSVVPVTLEAEFRPGWSVAAGAEWRHRFRVSTRIKSASFDGEAFVPDPARAGWHDATDSYRSDELAATFAVSRRWGGPGPSHSLAIRWVEGLQDQLPSPVLDIRHRALQLVWGWSD